MGNDNSLSCGSTAPLNHYEVTSTELQSAKQSKKWRLSTKKVTTTKLQRQRPNDISLDLAITDPAICSSPPAMSWNCHHKLENIEANLLKFRRKFDKFKPKTIKTKSLNDLMAAITPKQRDDLWMELDSITNNVSKTIHGITHNYLDGIPNERALLDYWSNTMMASHDDHDQEDKKTDAEHEEDGIAVIVFELVGMDKIHQHLGWQSGDNIIIETGKKMDEYCDWYSRDYGHKFKLFHPDFALNEYIVVTTCCDEQIIEDFSYCILTDIARSIKCFFQETTIWAGYVTNDGNAASSSKVAGMDLDHNGNSFRLWYERAKCAIKDVMNVSRFSDDKNDRIRKWLSPKEKLQKGHRVANIIHSYYVTNFGKDKYGEKQSKKHISMNETIKKIDICMKAGADLNYSDNVGNTPFFYALLLKNNELIRYLLQFEFDIHHRNNDGENVLIYALKNKIYEPICCILADRLKYPNMPDNKNMTPFIWALNYGYFKVMDILAEKGCMDYKNWIISSCIKNQEIVLCEIIRENHIKFKVRLDDIGRTILHYAVLHQSLNCIKTILKHAYIPVDITDNNGWSPLHYAAAKGYVEILKLLIDFDANLFLKTDDNLTPMRVAYNFKKQESILLLKKYVQHKLSLSNDSEFNRRFEPIKMELSSFSNASLCSSSERSGDSEQSDDSEKDDVNDINNDWDKENRDINIPNTESVTTESPNTKSHSNPSTNSENVVQKNRKFKIRNVSKIDENEDHFKDGDFESYDNDDDGEYDEFDQYDDDREKYNDSEDAESESVESNESNQTRIVHDSFSDEIQEALINYA